MRVSANVDIIGRNIKDCLAIRSRYPKTTLPTHINKIVFIFLVFSTDFRTAAQTSITVFKNSTKIVAGSDSKEGLENGDNATICKTYRLEDLFWSVAGLEGDSSPIVRVAKHNRTMRKMAEKFSELSLLPFKEGLIKLRVEKPNIYRNFMTNGHGGLDFIFFGMEDGILKIIWVPFVASENTEGEITVSASPIQFEDAGACFNGANACGFAIGHNKAMQPEMAKPGWGINLEGSVARFIQLEVDAHPKEVGPPIRILKIDSSGPVWIQHGEGCERLGDIPKEVEKAKQTHQ